MLKRRPDLPRHMKGGIDNPLGARAIYLGSTLYRIHGSNEPETIGTKVSSGCIRLFNHDIIDLYNRVPVGAPVVVLQEAPELALRADAGMDGYFDPFPPEPSGSFFPPPWAYE